MTQENWVGELEGFEYYTGPNKKTELNLYSDQFYNISTLTNVYGEIEGEIKDEVIVIGNHRDAWIKGGAGDPNSGSSSLLEIARGLGELQKQGYKFKRSIVLMSFDGEEYGLLGSTEYGEYAAKQLSKKVVAYLNVDVSVSGPVLGLQGCPSLYSVLKKAASILPYPEEGVGSLLDHYISHNGDKIGVLGSGSDYTVFLEHLGIPSVDMGFGPVKGSAIYHYHSNYDSYHWMETYGDKGFVYHNLMAKYLGLVALELSDREVLNLKVADYADYLIGYFEVVKKKIPKTWLKERIEDPDTLKNLLTYSEDETSFMKSTAHGYYKAKSPLPFPEFLKHGMCPKHQGSIMHLLEDHEDVTLGDLLDSTITDLEKVKETTEAFDAKSEDLQLQFDDRYSLPFWSRFKLRFLIIKQNKLLQYFERNFLTHKGLHQREWFKHIIYASGRFTGYAGQVYPALQEAIEDNDFDRLVDGLGVVSKTLRRIYGELS
ncbi:Zn-dependent exopeptidase [Yamadazyma tenuis ATCC 10573]|nr:Zn-dependent exopeptidase [Yamadazyma tenuis ATCC 10573]EGV62930.1 Zn-dependent exopeptidase [Yamadazyma tenuis ATCC 10573]